METDQILQKYSLTRDNATAYIDAITHKNQSETAEEIDVSRDTISRYKRAFQQMTEKERLLLISTLTQEKLLQRTTER